MGGACAICKKFYNKKVALYSVPRDPYHRKRWSRACNVKEFNKNAKICAVHFVTSDFIWSKRTRLHQTALPSRLLNPPLTSHPSQRETQNYEPPVVKPNPIARFYDVVYEVATMPKPKSTCAQVKVSEDHKEYVLYCSFCREEFLLWNWAKFVCHMKEKHPLVSASSGNATTK